MPAKRRPGARLRGPLAAGRAAWVSTRAAASTGTQSAPDSHEPWEGGGGNSLSESPWFRNGPATKRKKVKCRGPRDQNRRFVFELAVNYSQGCSRGFESGLRSNPQI